jgi:hypothetical protein
MASFLAVSSERASPTIGLADLELSSGYCSIAICVTPAKARALRRAKS